VVLDFEGDGLGDEGAALLAQVLRTALGRIPDAELCLPAVEVVLDDCRITEEGALKLAAVCEVVPRLTKLSLKFNPIFKQSGRVGIDEGDEDDDGEDDDSGGVSGVGSSSVAAARIEAALAKNLEARFGK
jgi:hypothetical protein